MRGCQGLYSLSGKTSYRKISWSVEAAIFGFKLFQSFWNLAGTSAALLPRCLSNFRAIRPLQHPISRLRDFTRFGGKTSYRLVNRGPELQLINRPDLEGEIGANTLAYVNKISYIFLIRWQPVFVVIQLFFDTQTMPISTMHWKYTTARAFWAPVHTHIALSIQLKQLNIEICLCEWFLLLVSCPELTSRTHSYSDK